VPVKEKLDLKVYFDKGLQFKTNDLYVILQMGSLTGFYSIFRLNVNLFLDYPMLESSYLFGKSKIPIRSDLMKKKKPMKIVQKPKEVQPIEKKPEPINENEALKRKSIAKFKRSKSKHIINQYGQIVGKEPNMKKKPEKIEQQPKPKAKSQFKQKPKQEFSHNIFDPNESLDDHIDNLYGTENTFEVKHVSHPLLHKKPKTEDNVDDLQLPEIASKTTMKLTFRKSDVDKANVKIPDDFEIIFNFRCTEIHKQWAFEWEELEVLRNQIIKQLQETPNLGKIMINGNQ
jgi:hypothetical protein